MKRIATIIASAADPEPLMKTDQMLALLKSEKICELLRLLKTRTGADRALVILHENDTVLLRSFLPHAQNEIEIHSVPSIYDPGEGNYLSGIVNTNSATENLVLSMSEAVIIGDALRGIPITGKAVTVAGEVSETKVIHVPIGTSFDTLIELSGGVTNKPYVIINGGPMGGEIASGNNVVSRKTKGILVLPEHSMLSKIKTRKNNEALDLSLACISCRACTDRCPMNIAARRLEPHKLMNAIAYRNLSERVIHDASICIDCGLCEVICPMMLSPNRVFRYLREKLEGSNEIFLKATSMNKNEKPGKKTGLIPISKLLDLLGLSKYDREPDFDIVPSYYDLKEVSIPIEKGSEIKVSPSEKVRKGDIIAIPPGGEILETSYASIDGRIQDISDTYVSIKAA